jgi:aspartate/tyrosine/aromatic aminotransferase
MFADLRDAPPDPILGMAQLFAADPDPRKVDLGIGVYKDDKGDVIVLDTVKKAEQWLVETQASKRFSSAGNPGITTGFVRCCLPKDPMPMRARTIQTPGGTGALRVAGDFIRHLRPGGRIFLPIRPGRTTRRCSRRPASRS